MKKLAVANQKGGVSKTTLCVHLAYAAMEQGKRVLLVDLDKQGSLTLSFPSSGNSASTGMLASSLYEDGAIGKPEYINDKLSIIRSDDRLALLDGFEDELIPMPAKNLKRFADEYDLAIIDTPGGIGMKLYAALTAADSVICPVALGLYEIAGLSELWQFIRGVKQNGYNPALRVLGILPCRINSKSREELDGLKQLRERFGEAIMPHTLAERAAVKQAISRRRPVWLNTKGAGHAAAGAEWKACCADILNRVF